MAQLNVSALLGKTLVAIEVDRTSDDSIIFHTSEGETYRMYHSQDCCETVFIEDICGDLEDLIGTPLTVAEEVSNYHEAFTLIHPNPEVECGVDESYTWTYYKFDTIKGGVTIRWFGTSNGYYSESVDFCLETKKEVSEVLH